MSRLALELVLAQYETFNADCQAAQYTDTGRAWEVLDDMANRIRDHLEATVEIAQALNALDSAYAKHQNNHGYTHLFSDDLQGAIMNVLKAAELED